MRMHACAGLAMGTVLALTGCGSVPISGDYAFGKLEGYVPNETVQQIKADRMTAAQVTALFGEPTFSVNGDAPAIAYLHCATVPAEHCLMVILLIPIPAPAGVCPPENQCQLVGIWFDATGHAVRTKSETGILYEGCHLPVWLRNRGVKACL